MSRPVLFTATIGALAIVGAIAASALAHTRPMSPHHRYKRAHHQAPDRIVVPADPAPWGPHYIPGPGIIDDACNLPTNRCPNEMRDIP